MTSNQTEEIVQTQLEVIRNDFQGTLYQAEGATLRMAMEAERYIDKRENFLKCHFRLVWV